MNGQPSDHRPTSFGQLLVRARRAAGLTQEQLAERAAVSWRAVSDLERGARQSPRRDTVTLLADALGLTGEERTAFEQAARRPSAPASDTSAGATPLGALPSGMLTFLIADVRGYTAYTHRHGDEAGAALATRFAALAGAAVEAERGQVVEVRGDEVLAVFTSARGALRAAVDLLARCGAASTEQLPLRAGVGLDVGEPIVVAGGYRGEVLNVAARLCAKAGPGEVLASEAVVSLARAIDGLAYSERGALELKGLSRPVGAWLVQANRDSALADEPAPTLPVPPAEPAPLPRGRYLGASPELALVARTGELAQIVAALEETAGGKGMMLLLAGEPGVGKTRLAQEALLRAREAGCVVLVGRCYAEQSTTPFAPFLDLLAAAWAATSPALRRLATERHSELGRLLPEVLPTPHTPEGEDVRLRVLRAVAAFLAGLAAETRLVLLLDDLHWADSASVDLLLHLTRQLQQAPVLLVGTYRDVEVGPQHPLQEGVAHLLRERLVEVISLQPLSLSDTGALIGTQFGMTEVSTELTGLIHRHTEGNAFFVEEVLKVLVEQGTLYRTESGWAHKAVDQMEVPFTVRAVVAQRVERLQPGTRDLLRTASVLGQEFSLDLLLGAIGGDENTVLDGLDEALHARVVEERRAGSGERYAFVHALIAQTLYEALPRHRARRLHLRVATMLEAAAGDKQVTEVARHLLAAGVPERAAPYLEQAGDQAADLYAHAEAIGHYRAAVTALQDAGQHVAGARVQRKLAGELVNMLRIDEALTQLNEALAVVEHAEERGEQALVHSVISRAYMMRLDFEAADPHLRSALALWPADFEEDWFAGLLGRAAARLLSQGHYADAETLQARLSALAERTGAPNLQLDALTLEADLQDAQGAPLSTTHVLYEQATLLAEQTSGGIWLGSVLHDRAVALMQGGAWAEAVPLFQRAIELAEQADLPWSSAWALGNLSTVFTNLGDWEAARMAVRRTITLVPDWANDTRLPWLLGRHAEQEVIEQRNLVAARKNDDVQGTILAALGVANVRLQLGKGGAAVAVVREATAMVRGRGLARFMPMVYAMQAEALAWEKDSATASVAAEAVAAVIRSEHFAYHPQVLRARGLYLFHSGDPAGAVTSLQESARVARKQSALVELGRTLAVLSVASRAAGDMTEAVAADAERLAIVERIGPEVRGLVWTQGLPG